MYKGGKGHDPIVRTDDLFNRRIVSSPFPQQAILQNGVARLSTPRRLPLGGRRSRDRFYDSTKNPFERVVTMIIRSFVRLVLATETVP